MQAVSARRNIPNDPHNRRLQVRHVHALRLIEAIERGSLNDVHSLLASRVNPSQRFDQFDSPLCGVELDWASDSERPPVLFSDMSQLPELYRAVQKGSKAVAAELTRVLLEHGADPYSLNRQWILVNKNNSIFPGDQSGHADLKVEEEEYIRKAVFARYGIIERALRLDRKE